MEIVIIIVALFIIGLFVDKKPEQVEREKEQNKKANNYHQLKRLCREYKESYEWKEKRLLAIRRDGACCRSCKVSAAEHRSEYGFGLDVHHIRYTAVPNEPVSDLVTVCRGCHDEIHKYKGYNYLAEFELITDEGI